MKRKWKIILTAAVGILILGAVAYENIKPLEANLLKIEKRSIAKTFKEEGIVVPDVEMPVFPPYAGEIIELPVEEGQEVKKGELLAVLDSKDLVFQLEQLEAQLKSVEGEEAKTYREPYQSQVKQQLLAIEQAERDLETARKNFERISRLYEAGAASTEEYETSENAVKSAENALEQQREALSLLYESHKPASGTSQYYAGLKQSLKAQIDSVRLKIDESRITAPVDGIVSDLAVKKGTVVDPSSPIMTVFQEGSYVVEVFVLTEDVAGLERGMKVKLIQDRSSGDIVFDGTIRKIAPSAVEKISALGLEEQRVKITVEPEMPENLELRPGYALDVQFTIGEQENQLVVPKTALFPFEGGEALWVVRNGKAQVQPVKKGFENDREVAIVKGLEEGDYVILNPQLEGLKEGKRVIGK